MKTYVLYHANCPDGFGAAYAAWKALGFENVEYLPCAYGKPLPAIDAGSRVFIVDFSFSRPDLLALREQVCELLVLDHHKTAQAALEGLDFARFDMAKSGAVLTWEHFFPSEPVPELLLYVQDRDLWQWQLPDSQVINLALWKGTLRKFEKWRELHEEWHTYGRNMLIDAGKTLAFADSQTIALLCKHPQWQHIGAWSVPTINSPVLQSEIGHELLQQHATAPFAAVWCQDGEGQRIYSLRARPDDFDVSVVAKAFGGGGHAAAAGFKLYVGCAPLAFPEKKEGAS